MTQSTFTLTSSCVLTSISLQSNSRLATSKCPFFEARISAVHPLYIFFIINKILIEKTHPNKIREENLERVMMTQSTFQLTLSCTLTSICLQSNSRLTTSKYPCLEARISAVHPFYYLILINTFFTIKQNFIKKTHSKKKNKN